MFGIRLHLPLFDQSVTLPGYSRLVVNQELESVMAQRDWYAINADGRLYNFMATTFENSLLPTRTSTRDDLLESSYPGSDRILFNWTPTDPIGPPRATLVGLPQTTIRVDGDPGDATIFGAMLLADGSLQLLAAALFDAPIPLREGMLIHYLIAVT